jgi:hypothetical protein
MVVKIEIEVQRGCGRDREVDVAVIVVITVDRQRVGNVRESYIAVARCRAVNGHLRVLQWWLGGCDGCGCRLMGATPAQEREWRHFGGAGRAAATNVASASRCVQRRCQMFFQAWKVSADSCSRCWGRLRR